MYQYYLQLKDKTFREVIGYQLQNDLAAHKELDKTWTVTDVLSGVMVLNKQETLVDATKILNTSEMLNKITALRKLETYSDAKDNLYCYVMSLPKDKRVDGWKRYVRGNR